MARYKKKTDFVHKQNLNLNDSFSKYVHFLVFICKLFDALAESNRKKKHSFHGEKKT
jgi:hypothetical protein